MQRSEKRLSIRSILYIVSFVLLGVSFIWLLSVYGSFPDEMGIHYGEDNEFDVYASKAFAFYPFVAGFGLCGTFSLLGLAVKKVKKVGKDLSAEKIDFIRNTALWILAVMSLFWAVFFSIWNYCVIHQTRMFTFGLPIREFQKSPIYMIFIVVLVYDSYFNKKLSKGKTAAGVIFFLILLVIVVKFFKV